MANNVTHLNVRLSEGGAAMVARGLAQAAGEHGWTSRFLYGYGPHGNVSPQQEALGGTRITSKTQFGINHTLFRHLGRDLEVMPPRQRHVIAEALAQTSVVHLHCVHSYFVGFDRLVDLLVEAGRPVVWTLHDSWVLTGRCAIPGPSHDCELWKQGCPTCPHLDAYPAARRQTTASGYLRRRASIDRLAAGVDLQMVACAQWLQRDVHDAGFTDARYIGNSVDPAFWATVAQGQPAARSTERPKLLFIARRLDDIGKVKHDLLAEVAHRGGDLLLVGDNKPSSLGHVPSVGAISDRAELVELMRSRDRLLYTSTVDVQPLTVGEALAAGMDVLALETKAAHEFDWHPNCRVSGPEGFVEAALAPVELAGGAPEARLAPQRMAAEYYSLYEELARR